ncbi:Os02g0697500 [Oryza sativa Japonica Group]|uniref:Os02g0697500 protein n=2 Tax=Oryza sativa subsp. japonica TaxID=39947 RepID=A0A0P0VNA0_ORYSJ|nr:hypothetical protein EE612_013081 [Oryza sativa]BAD07860.1 unknown protein [Oryza sativa Japonica Group]BAF09734.1 Os02g0697500 [Oryza sativa Japonica Group]BAS80428.1 Os02g0697500 [Oryza sativa Japonica Group]|eukprot:NP_001047820.1 Os02g0697500 [Oryza sativa Japonica Group]
MVGGLVLSQAQHQVGIAATSPAQAQAAEQAAFRGRDHRAPCANLDEARKAHARHVKLGLLSTPEGAPVRVVTNLRMSKECHAYSALISEIFGREIVVRDRNRFHRFKRGACSCRNYW